MNKQSVVVAESSHIVSKGLIQIISQIPYIDKIFELDDSQSISEQIADYNPDIIIINHILLGTVPFINPRELLKLDNKVHLVALVYTLVNQQYLQHFDSTISINDSPIDIVNKLKSLSNTKKTEVTENEELSDREKEILATLVKGFSNKEIADYHNISIHTVITHRRNITRKLNIHSPSGLTV